jgi:tetratricopeptide (TPR) repeat protein
MLKDEKNKEFQDQIYSALAEVALAEDLDSLGIHYLKMSVSTSVSNNFQKATSALQLADIYFVLPDYENAQAYYDTAVQFLPEEYPDYEEIRLKADKLSDLVINLQTIQLEDSLQKLAMMSEDERHAVIDKIIEDFIAEEERRAELEALAQAQAEMGALGGGGPSFGGGDGNWYFYNAQTKSSGYSAFVQQWGRRKLEDLWRLRDKQVSAFEEEFITEVSIDSLVSDSTLLMIKDPHSRQYYLQDIPFTVEERMESDQKIINAFYNLGLIYREGLNDLPKAINTYEELLDRYPDNEFQLQAYYQLYRLFLDLEDEERANYYKMLIINRYPDSDYAKIIQDPEYYLELQQRQNQLAVLYSDTYEAFIDGRYFTVIDNCDLALAQYSDSSALIPKFEYLKAVSIGKIDVVDSLVIALRRIVENYPGSEVEPMAQNILDYITKERPEFALEEQGEEADSVIVFPFTYDPEITHIYVMIVKKEGVKLNPTKVKVSDFNQKYYRIKEYTINSLLFDRNHYLISVGNFPNAMEALDYYNTIQDNDYVFSDISMANVQQFIISTDNYPILFKEKDNELYGLFFEQEYLGQ